MIRQVLAYADVDGELHKSPQEAALESVLRLMGYHRHAIKNITDDEFCRAKSLVENRKDVIALLSAVDDFSDPQKGR